MLLLVITITDKEKSLENFAKIRPEIESGKNVFGLFGFPVSHSLSPLMHNKAYNLTNIDAVYLPFSVDVPDLELALKEVFDSGLTGLNVTIPLKEHIEQYLDDISPEAAGIGSVNTIHFANGKRKGYNTDLEGFLTSLREHVKPIEHEQVTVFGSGGVARTVLFGLLHNFNFPQLTMITRIEDKKQAENLLDNAEKWKKGSTMLDWVELNNSAELGEHIWESRLLVNCTPLGMKSFKQDFPDYCTRFFRPGQIAYDIIYTPLRTSFIQNAEKRGALTLSGLDMFIHQGAQSFKIWTGIDMPIDPIKELLLNHFTSQEE